MLKVVYSIEIHYTTEERRQVNEKKKPKPEERTWAELIDTPYYKLSGFGYYDDTNHILICADVSKNKKPYVRLFEIVDPVQNSKGWYKSTFELVEDTDTSIKKTLFVINYLIK